MQLDLRPILLVQVGVIPQFILRQYGCVTVVAVQLKWLHLLLCQINVGLLLPVGILDVYHRVLVQPSLVLPVSHTQQLFATIVVSFPLRIVTVFTFIWLLLHPGVICDTAPNKIIK